MENSTFPFLLDLSNGGRGPKILSYAELLAKMRNRTGGGVVSPTGIVFAPDLVEPTYNGWMLFIMYGCVMLTMNTIGCVTNCITIYVFKKYPVKSSTYILLQIMAVADSSFLLFSIFNLSIRQIYVFVGRYREYLNTWVRSLPYLRGFHEISRDYAVWMVALVTIDRYIGICHPLKATRINTVKRALIAAIVLLIVIILFNVPMFMLMKIIKDKTDRDGYLTFTNSDLANDANFCWGYFVTDAVVNLLVPIIFVITMNAAIVRMIAGANKQRMTMTSHSSDNARSSHRTNVMLVIVAVIFVLCEVPKIVEQVMYFTGRQMTFDEFERNIPVPLGVASEFLQHFNSFVNFYVYCLVGKKFQRILMSMRCCQMLCGKRAGLHHDDMSSINKTMSFRLTRSRRSKTKSNGGHSHG